MRVSRARVRERIARDGSIRWRRAPAADDDASRPDFAAAHRELDQRLRAEPQVVDVTFSLTDAGRRTGDGARSRRTAAARQSRRTTTSRKAAVPATWCDTTGSRSTSSTHSTFRLFSAAISRLPISRTDHVIISRTLAESAFGTTNPLGGRIKYVGRSREADADDDDLLRSPRIPAAIPLERWYEVVGVVPDFPANRARTEAAGLSPGRIR